MRCIASVLLLVLAGTAHAQVPDASLRAVKDRIVRLELDGAPAVEGRVLGFEAGSVTLAVASTNEVITVPRDKLARVIVVAAAAPPPEPEKLRVFALQFGVPGTIAVDADYRHLHGFASVNALVPELTAAGDSFWYAATLGGGYALKLSNTSRWKLDVFANVSSLRITSFYTYAGLGVGAGFHYTAASGLTAGIAIPLVGFSTRIGTSAYGYDPPYRYNESIGYYYFGSLVGLPMLTIGYRFATNCPAD